jgi:hypothetical protein
MRHAAFGQAAWRCTRVLVHGSSVRFDQTLQGSVTDRQHIAQLQCPRPGKELMLSRSAVSSCAGTAAESRQTLALDRKARQCSAGKAQMGEEGGLRFPALAHITGRSTTASIWQ